MTVSGGKGNVKRAEREAMQAQIDALVDRLESLPTCRVCRVQSGGVLGGHAKWHDYCQAEINPIALVQFIERCEPSTGVARILNYVLICSGMDERWRLEREEGHR